MALASPFARRPDTAADTLVYLASSPEVADATGGYYVDRAREPGSRDSNDMEAARRLWELSAQLVTPWATTPSA